MKRELLRMDHVNLEAGGERLLDNLNFQIFAGEIMGLVSRSFKGHDQLIGLIGYNRPIRNRVVRRQNREQLFLQRRQRQPGVCH